MEMDKSFKNYWSKYRHILVYQKLQVSIPDSTCVYTVQRAFYKPAKGVRTERLVGT